MTQEEIINKLAELSAEEDKLWSLLIQYVDIPRINKVKACWLWTGKVNRDGYGAIRWYIAHREMYKRFFGSIRTGYVVHHMCHNKRCINPMHLLEISRVEHSKLHAFKVDRKVKLAEETLGKLDDELRKITAN